MAGHSWKNVIEAQVRFLMLVVTSGTGCGLSAFLLYSSTTIGRRLARYPDTFGHAPRAGCSVDSDLIRACLPDTSFE